MPGASQRLDELLEALAQRDAENARQAEENARQAKEVAERDVEIARLGAEVERLTELVASLKERLGQDSNNSSKPPSSDTPASRNKRK